ncbi:hypothetical protein [Nocardia salmonicida]|uniref:hypothetical protein n=1 Tax=Nocardia salmonicida TaxID=53431 RepID=UPI00340EDA15
MTTDDARTSADHATTEQTPTDAGPEVACPIAVGDEVNGHNNRTWRAVVCEIYDDDGGIPIV